MKNIIILVIACIIGFKFKSKFLSLEKIHKDYIYEQSELRPSLPTDKTIGHVKLYFKNFVVVGGHGFVLNTGRKQYVTTAAHLFKGKFDFFGDPITKLDSIDIIRGEKTFIQNARPLSGPSYSTCDGKDNRNDVGFFRSNDLEIEQGFQISVSPALKGQNVWLFCTFRESSTPTLKRATVTKSSTHILNYTFDSGIHFPGTSGCPILNHNLEVVGINVCGRSISGSAVPLNSIKNSLKKI